MRIPEDFVIQLKTNVEAFINDFWKEYKRQTRVKNKSSEKRMRKLLSSFNDRVQKPYRKSSLNKESANLKDILGEKNADFKNTS